MAAYAALVSLTHILDQILHPPPGHQILFVREEIESLRENLTFFTDFLENYSSRRSNIQFEDLETRITDVAYAAEDVIESNVMNQIRAKSSGIMERSAPLCEGIPKVIENFLSIKEELVKIKGEKGPEDMQPINSTTVSSSRPLSSGKNITVGIQEHLIQIMSTLTTDESHLQIIPIVGMGGIGKTTLAANVYNNPFITEHFHICAWVTLSQEYTEREILLGLLHQSISTDPNEQGRSENLVTFTDKMIQKKDDELGVKLHKNLFERKYLIVMDDMWNIEAWDKVQRYLPDNENGSRILVTTRLLKLAVDFESCSPYEMSFLGKEQSWNLLRDKVFAQEGCPVELENIGKSIAMKCGGLPLALVVIGGVLARSKKAREEWKYIEKDVASALNCENDEQYCMKILSLSYSHLPIYLKPCFLYLAMFPEDFEIPVSKLIKLWVAEGFIKPTTGKSLEEVAEEYLEDLVERNLILVSRRGSSGKMKQCRIHDLIRDLCKKEADKDKFLRIAEPGRTNTSYKKSQRRLGIHYRNEENVRNVLHSAAVLNRSLLSCFSWISRFKISRRIRLLRVLDVVGFYSIYEIPSLINSRYVACTIYDSQNFMPSSISRLWNLQTLVLDGRISLPVEIWDMPQLRHLKIKGITLRNPSNAQTDVQNFIVLENLQTLSKVEYFMCTEQILKRIPNVKKLGITYGQRTQESRSCCFSKLVLLHKLESFVLKCNKAFSRNITFPSSLKKLKLSKCKIPWENMSMIGSLPNLEVLKLLSDSFIGKEWNPVEGEFCRLKSLVIYDCELEIWGADNTHFPSLEHIYLGLSKLTKIPMGFAEIPTLQVIHLLSCCSSLSTSANEISKERENLGYDEVSHEILYFK